MRPAVKAGLIGAGVATVLTLLGLIPLCGCIAEPLIWLAYGGAGALAAHYMLTSRPVTPSYAPPLVEGGARAGGAGELDPEGGATADYPDTPAVRRPAGSPAGEGALAGLITATLQGLVRVALAPLSLSLSGGPQTFINAMPPESLQVLRDAGIDPATLFGTATFVTASAVCCGIGIVVAAGLGALGGLIYAAIKQR